MSTTKEFVSPSFPGLQRAPRREGAEVTHVGVRIEASNQLHMTVGAIDVAVASDGAAPDTVHERAGFEWIA